MRVGSAWRTALGYSPTDLVGRPFSDVVHPEDVGPTLAELDLLIAGGLVATFENRCRGADGEYRWLRWNAAADAERQTIFALAIDVSDRKRFEAEVARRALRDELTGLPNRALFVDRVDYALAHLARRSSHVAVILLDIDDFHVVNDTLGRAAGDAVLVEIARRLVDAVRTSDTVARFGSDQFAVLCTDTDESAVLEIAERLAAAVSAPLVASGRSLVLTASTGVAVERSPRVGEMLVGDADVALHRATASGSGRVEFFDRELRAESVRRMELEVGLRRAIEHGELTLVYQPIIDLAEGRALAFEALVRWQHPERGLLSPAIFVPLAEESGLIAPLGEYVLEAACAEATRWAGASANPPAIAVNVSPRQLADPELVSVVSRALESARLEPSRLWLEVTESAVLANLDASLETLAILHGLGVQIAIDDFGEGQSSLSQLTALTPVSILKIGAPFVAKVDERTSRGRAVVEAMLNLGRAIGLRTIAEGVERPEQVTALEELGCAAAQGFHFGRPEPPAMLPRWLEPGAFAKSRLEAQRNGVRDA
jgi:diguanylate cyclase (GGDEF)-like protein/PAS domain S-box-containing protein